MTPIQMPHELKKGGNAEFINRLFAEKDAIDLVLDFSTLKFAYPISALKVGANIRTLVTYRARRSKATSVSGVSWDDPCHSYLSHVGYFDFIGIKHGNKIGEAHGSSRYLPITKLTRTQLLADAAERGATLQGVILEKAMQIANILMSFNDESNTESVAYSLKEVIRNVFEHSHSEECFLFIQRYKDDVVQLAIFDEGIGIKSSLNTKYQFSTDIDAIKEAIQPGVSCVDFAKSNVNNNSGYGLYVLSELGREFGWFEMSSGINSFLINSTGSHIHQLPPQRGTFVGIDLTNTKFNMQEKLDEIIEGGQYLARIQGNNPVASSSSKGLSI